MQIYNTVKETFYEDDFGQYTSYGISVIKDNGVLLHISDLCLDKNSVDCFCSLLNYCEVNPNDIFEYIEEFLANID